MSRRWLPFGEDDSVEAGRPATAPAAVGHLVGALRGRRGWKERLEGAQVHTHWEEIAGPELARHVTPVRLVRGVLVLRAASPAWAAQVHYLTSELAGRANDVLGQGTVTKVTITTGSAGR